MYKNKFMSDFNGNLDRYMTLLFLDFAVIKKS